MTRYAKRKLKYSLNQNFNLLPYVEWDRFVTLTGAQAEWGLRYSIYDGRSSTNIPILVSDWWKLKTLFNLLADSDDILKNYLENAKKNATYTSKTIQNDFIDVIGEYIKDKLMERIKQDGSVFTIIADETTDMFNQEVLALCFAVCSESAKRRD